MHLDTNFSLNSIIIPYYILKMLHRQLYKSAVFTYSGVLRPQIPEISTSLKYGFLSRRKLSTITDLTESLVALHATTQIPWWILVPTLTISFRALVTLPLAISNRRRQVKSQALKPILNSMYPILKFNLMRKQLKSDSPLSYEQVALLSAKERRSRQKKLYKEHNCQTWKNLGLPLVQIPLWILLSLTMRNLSGWDSFFVSSTSKAVEPSVVNEGCLWFQDLSHADPYGVLPICLGLVTLTNVEFVGRFYPGASDKVSFGSSVVKDSFTRVTLYDALLNISRLSIVFFMGIASQAPAILSLYWISSNLFSLVQNLVFNWIWPLKSRYYEDSEKYLFGEKTGGEKPLVRSRDIKSNEGKKSDGEVEELLHGLQMESNGEK